MAATCVAMLAVSAPALARDKYIQQFKEKDVLTIAPDKAYLLYRANVGPRGAKPEVIFVRDLTAAEILIWNEAKAKADAEQRKKLEQKLAAENALRAQQRLKPLAALPEKDVNAVPPSLPEIKNGVPNVVRIDSGRTVAKSETERTYLIEVPAGTYLIAGQSFDNMVGGTCMCMGSVRFEAVAGKVTDLGHILAAPENGFSDVPEFAGLSNDPKITLPPWIMTVRPPSATLSMPPQMRGQTATPAHYVAAAKFPNYFGMLVNRMPPLAGVLSYRGDMVLGAGGVPVAVADKAMR